MRGLLLKDWFLIKKSISVWYLFPLVVITASLWSNTLLLIVALPLTIAFLTVSLALSTFTAEETCNWLSFPVRFLYLSMG